MKLTVQRSLAAAIRLGISFAWLWMSVSASAQGMTTTTVQGTVYLANGRTGSGTLQVSWPAFTTAGNQAVAAGRTNVTIGADGYVSVKLAPNLGSTPAGLYYTAVYHLSDGTTSTEYWVVPAAAQASLAQIRAQVMPAAQAVQAVNKSYVDQSIAELTQSLLTASGGTLSGPLYLNGDPTKTQQAATKHYVDAAFANAVPMSGAALTGPLTSVQLGAAYQVDQFPGADFGAKLQACLNKLDAVYGGTCDGRNFSGTLGMSSGLVIATANATVQLPCATIATANQIRVTAGTRNVTLRGCALRGASTASGSAGGTVFLYSGTGPLMQVGDPTYTSDTPGFHLDNAVINTTASASASAQGLAAYRTQEINLQGLYFLGNSNQTGMTLDGTGNYTGGTFQDLELGGFGTAVNAIGHQVSNAASTDWLNASTFLRLHINCPTSDGSPVAGTYGINLQQGDGNTFTGGDVEGCGTALHLGPNAQNNTIVGLRNENSISQVVAEPGSAYNNWITGGTMFAGKLTDNGTRNSFLDTFHRSFNGLNGDWYGSQNDATVTNHYRIGTGAGNERGLLNRYQTDYGYRWTTGLSDAAAGEQFYQVLDELNDVYRISIGQYNNGQSSTNNQTVINAAGSGAVVLNGSANSGTGGVIFGAGGSNGATVATINSAGNAQFNGSLQVAGPTTFSSSATVKNQVDAEIDSVLWAGATANQKESFIYKDYTGASQWYMVKDASNNWALNSAIGGLDSFKAYQSNNSGDTYINASKSTGHIRLNYETGSGAETDIYGGSSSALVAAFLGSTAIKFPGLAAASAPSCLQIDNSGYISNTGTACGTGSSGVDGTVSAGMTGQVAYYAGNGRVLAGMNAVTVSSGGTGASTAEEARQNLGAQRAMTGVASDGGSGMVVAGNVAANAAVPALQPVADVTHPSYGAKGDGATDDAPAARAALAAVIGAGGGTVYFPKGTYRFNSVDPANNKLTPFFAQGSHIHVKCDPGAVIDAGGIPNASNVFMFGFPTTAMYAIQADTGYQANVLTLAGSSTITLTTPADTSHFAVGDSIYILGGPGFESNGDGEINWITAIDTVGGILTLRVPTSKPYTGNVSNVGALGIVTVIPGVDHSVTPALNRFYEDESIEGCTVINSGADFVWMGEVIHAKILNNHVTMSPTAWRGMGMNSYYPMADIEIAGNDYVQGPATGAPFCQLADGFRDIDIHDNVFYSPYGVHILNPSQGNINIHIHHNRFYQVIPSTYSDTNNSTINMGTGTALVVDGNIFNVNNQKAGSNANVISLGQSNGVCTDCAVTNNIIRYTALSTISTSAILDLGSNAVITGNHITLNNVRWGIRATNDNTLATAKSVITSNSIHFYNAHANSIGIVVDSPGNADLTQSEVVVSSNQIYGDSTANGTGISFSVPGGGVVNGNQIYTLATGIDLGGTGTPILSANECTNVTTTTNCGTPGFAQTGSDNAFTAGTQDFHAAAHTLPAKSGTIAGKPATCTTGEEYFATDATPGSNKYLCTSTNIWTASRGALTTVPLWLQFLGDGSEGASTCSGTISAGGEHWYSSFTINAGATCTGSIRNTIIRVNGPCTINGTMDVSAVGVGTTSVPAYGGSGGSGGGGTAAGGAGGSTLAVAGTSGAASVSTATGPAGGSSSGGAGGNGAAVTTGLQKAALAQGIAGGYGWGGGAGGAGGSSGGAGGNGGEDFILTCSSITFGANNLIDASGGPGQPSTANSVGTGGGGGGGVVVIRSPSVTGTPTINVNGGPGGSCTVPMAQWSGGGGTGITTTATVTTGGISACSVGGTTTGFNSAPKCTIVGGGGSGGTCHFTFSSGTVTGCVVDAAGSGYTQSTFTTCGSGGTGGLGWSKVIAN